MKMVSLHRGIAGTLGKKMMVNVHRVDDDVASVWCAVSIFCGNRTWSVMISAVAIVQQ